MSRWFSWSTSWKRFRPLWSFLRSVYMTWQLMLSEGDIAQESEAADNPGGEGAQAEPAARGPNPIPGAERVSVKQQARSLLKDLRELQKTRHTLDIVRDVLGDVRIKHYADMLLDGVGQQVC